MRLTRTIISDLLADHNLAPSRALGQNFLCDPSMVDKIVRLANISPGDRVIEIGPGLGSLTLGLCDAGAEVTLIEIDKYIIPVLNTVIADAGFESSVNIINSDVMEFDWNLLDGSSYKVVANLPYNIATPMILDLLAAEPKLDSWIVMVQKEAGDRLVASPGSKIYGIPSVLAQYWADLKVVGNVPPEVFLPRPRVDSVLIKIIRKTDAGCQEEFKTVSKLVRSGFGQRRKMLRKSLGNYLSETEIADSGIDPTLRAENLDLDSWKKLAACL